MSVQITTAFVEQYSANVDMLSQQSGSRFRPNVDVETVTGKNAFFEQVGVTAARVRPSRHADTPRMDTPHARRRVSLVDYDWADLIDDEDKVRMLIDPTSPYAKAASAAMGRSMDDVLIAAASGTASTGVAGGTSTTLPSGQKIAHGSAGLTKAKLISAKELFLANEVDPDDMLYMAVRSGQIGDLLGVTEVASADYNTVRALAIGEVDTFMGFKFVHSERLASDGTSRLILAWAESGLKLAIGSDISAKISERDDKNYATQVFYSMSIGATRMEEVKVVEIACSE